MSGESDGPAPDFELGGRRWCSRLIVGTGGFRSQRTSSVALVASATEIVTVAMRRVDPGSEGTFLDVIDRHGLFVVPNTAGCSRRGTRSGPRSWPARRSAPSG